MVQLPSPFWVVEDTDLVTVGTDGGPVLVNVQFTGVGVAGTW